MKRLTTGLLLSLPVATLALAADALEPGQGVFYNPVFWLRSQLTKFDSNWREQRPLDAGDKRLEPCVQYLSETVLTEAQEGLRGSLVGTSETLALQQLGPPTCRLADSLYRWVTASGLALDVEIQDSEVRDARLAR
jgi:hypothetical protein